MIATSANVLSNVIYLIGAVAVAAVGILVLWFRHREPTSVDAKMASFQKGLSALAPDRSAYPPSRTGARDWDGNFKVRPLAPPASHVHLDGAAGGQSGADGGLDGGSDGRREDGSPGHPGEVIAHAPVGSREGYAGVVGDEGAGPPG